MTITSKLTNISNFYKHIIPFIRDSVKYKHIVLQLFDLFIHKILINTSPVDYYRFEFYKKGKTFIDKRRYLGKRGSYFYPYNKNEIRYVPIFDNKFIFKHLISGFNLPQPNIVATIGKDYEINTYNEFLELIKTTNTDIVVKPIEGSGGKDIYFKYLDRCDFYGRYNKYDVNYFWENVCNVKPGGFLVEERVKNVDSLASLHPTSLNTFRIITIKADDDKWYSAGCFLKVGSGGRGVDNLGAGGIHLCIDNNGKTFFAYDWTQRLAITYHPDTKVMLLGINIEGYRESINLALDASKNFNFMGTIGWDIAFTNSGPKIIEGNVYYDCWYWQIGPRGGLISTEIAEKLSSVKMWHRWDKTKIYPRFNRERIIA